MPARTSAVHIWIDPVSTVAEHVHTKISSPLTASAADLLNETVLPLLRSGRQVVVDLSKVTAVDATAAHVLHELSRTARHLGTHLHLAAAAGSQLADTVRDNPVVRRLLGVGTASD